MSDWKTVELINACHKITDGAHKSPPTVTNGYPMASVKDMTYNGIDSSNCRNISRKDYLELVLNNCKPQINDVLIAKDGSYLKHIVLVTEEQEVVLLSSIAIIRPNMDVISPKFLKYIFLNPSFRDTVEGNFVTGAVIPRIVLKDFKQIPILLPPLPEQKAIAAVLSSLDDKIDLLHRQNKTLEAMAETLFRQWFVDEAEIKTVQLGEIIEIYDSRRIPLSSTERDKMKTGTLYPYYGAAKVMDYINDFIFDGESLLLGEDGTVQTNEGYPILQMAVGRYWVNNHTHVLSAKKPYSNFLLYSILKKASISHIVTGAVQPKINQENLKSLEIEVPSDEIIIDTVSASNYYWDKIQTNNDQIRTLEKLRNTLLPKLMSGEVRVAIK
jgi:type I restriction enzyme S subunit